MFTQGLVLSEKQLVFSVLVHLYGLLVIMAHMCYTGY